MIKRLKNLLPLASNTTDKGRWYELKAREYLKQHGLKHFLHNVHSRYGEVDLIAWDGDVLVFTEVRYRREGDHGSAVATVDKFKQRKIIRTAQYFLLKNGLTNKVPCRFDVVGISGSGDELGFHWIKNAFH